MHTIIEFTLHRKIIFNLLFVLLMVFGAYALLRMPVERYPNFSFGKVTIDTFYPGASPTDVELLVTKQLEDALDDLEDVDYILSNSYRERSYILVKFLDDCDYQKRYNDLRLKILPMLKDLPATSEPPVFNYLDVNDWFPVISVNISGKKNNRTLTLAAEELKSSLGTINGIKNIKLLGEYTREFQVILDPEKLRNFGITFSETALVLRQNNLSIPAGDHTTTGGEFIIRVDEQFRSRDQLLSTVIRKDGDGAFVRLSDVIHDARSGYRDPYVITSVNGRECVTLQILKKSDGNAIHIARQTRALIQEMQAKYNAEDIHLTLTQDSTIKINDSIRVLGSNLFLGIVLVCFLIWAFMGFRNAALTTIGIPFAFLVTMIFMYLTGNSINELSLFSFILVSGIIVDDAIVVVENIFRHVQAGKTIRDSVIDGTSEVFLPVVAATFTTIAAFLPMLMMTGSVGDFFALIPKTVTFALAASLFECLLILPIHFFDFGPRATNPDTQPTTEKNDLDSLCPWKTEEKALMSRIRLIFNQLLFLALRFRYLALLSLGAAFALALFILFNSLSGKTNLIRIQFFPDDYSLYYAEIIGPAGTPITTTNQLVKKLAEKIKAKGPGMTESALGYAGFYINENYTPVWGNHLGHVAVTLPPGNKRHFNDFPVNDPLMHLENMEQLLLPHLPKGFSLNIRPEKDGPPAGKDINIRILGADAEAVSQLSQQMLEFLAGNKQFSPWLDNLKDDQGLPGRVFHIKLNKDLISEWQLNTEQVTILAASALNGQPVGKFRLPDEEVDIKLKVWQPPGSDITAALDIPIADYPEGTISLRDLTSVDYSQEPGFLNRFQGQRAITLTADIRPGAPFSTQTVIKDALAFYQTIQADFPGAGLNFAGEYESTQKSYTSLTYAFIVALLLIYLILATQFNSYMQPLIILSAVIFALTGVILGTFLARTLFTINSFVAIIGVTGVVVNDSLVLVEFINKCYQKGLNRREALIRATNIRLRPILLTTLTTTLGLLPMALGIPEYSLTWGTMAMTFVTGLCTATFLTIVIVPVEWDIVMKLQENRKKRKNINAPFN